MKFLSILTTEFLWKLRKWRDENSDFAHFIVIVFLRHKWNFTEKVTKASAELSVEIFIKPTFHKSLNLFTKKSITGNFTMKSSVGKINGYFAHFLWLKQKHYRTAILVCATFVPFERTLVAVQGLNRRWVCRLKIFLMSPRRTPRFFASILLSLWRSKGF